MAKTTTINVNIGDLDKVKAIVARLEKERADWERWSRDNQALLALLIEHIDPDPIIDKSDRQIVVDCPTENGGTRSVLIGVDSDMAAALAALDAGFDLVGHLDRQRKFSETTFGPGARVDGVLDHISKEIEEVRADPTDIMEWIDLVLLALDGAWRSGASSVEIAEALERKMSINESRTFPDWRTADPHKAIEHNRDEDR